jgi:AAHS family 4-hydroxybenzoate transporter-like MFS transporter
VPTLMAEWRVARSEFSFVLAAGMLGMVVGAALAGVAGDRFGRRVALFGSVVVFGTLTLLTVFATGLGSLAALRFIAGLGLGGAIPNATALASELVPARHRPVAVTSTIVCMPLGASLGAFMASVLLPWLGWRALFAVGGGMALAVGVLIWLRLPESPRFLARDPRRWGELTSVLARLGHPVARDATFEDRTEAVIHHASVGDLFSTGLRRDTLALCVAYFCCLLTVYASLSWVPAMLTSAGLSVAVAARGLSAFNMGGVVGALAGAWIITRAGSRVTMLVMTAGAIAGAIVMSAMSIEPSGVVLIMAMLAWTGGLINAVQTTMYALAAHVYPTVLRATGVGTAVGIGRVGGVLSTYAGAWALEWGGTSGLFVLLALAMTLVFLALATVGRHVPRPAPEIGATPGV